MKCLTFSILLLHLTFGNPVDNFVDPVVDPKILGDLLKDGFDTVFNYNHTVTIESEIREVPDVNVATTEFLIRNGKNPHDFILQLHNSTKDGVLDENQEKRNIKNPFLVTIDPTLPYGIKETRGKQSEIEQKPKTYTSIILYGLAVRIKDVRFMIPTVEKYEPVIMEVTSKKTILGTCKVKLELKCVDDDKVSVKAMINRKTCGYEGRKELEQIKKEGTDVTDASEASIVLIFEKATGKFIKGKFEAALHLLKNKEPRDSIKVKAFWELAGFRPIERDIDESALVKVQNVNISAYGLY